MRIGFTGTRKGMTDAQIKAFRNYMINGPTLVTVESITFRHGGCQGADVQAAQIIYLIYEEDSHIVCHPGPLGDPHQEVSGVDDEVLPPKTHFARNRDIVNASDILIACPCDISEQPHGGTWYTVRHARKMGKSVVVVWPDGRLEALV